MRKGTKAHKEWNFSFGRAL